MGKFLIILLFLFLTLSLYCNDWFVFNQNGLEIGVRKQAIINYEYRKEKYGISPIQLMFIYGFGKSSYTYSLYAESDIKRFLDFIQGK
jgi:hypothetical protein